MFDRQPVSYAHFFRLQGTRYFTAMQNYGGFCRANVILTGDYPAEDEGDDLDEEL
jgi:hypothetical protein